MEYARFSEESNSIDYLEKAVSFMKNAEKPEDWKWAVLAVHGALYGFMICTLKGSSPDNVSTGKGRLISFNEALKRCQDTACMNLGGFTKVLRISQDQRRALCRLHSDFRNQFVHYNPTLLSIPEDVIRETLMHALDALRAIFEMGCYYLHLGPGDSDKIATMVADGKEFLQKSPGGDIAAV